eukprot:5293964-Amphidinium_carterae.1
MGTQHIIYSNDLCTNTCAQGCVSLSHSMGGLLVCSCSEVEPTVLCSHHTPSDLSTPFVVASSCANQTCFTLCKHNHCRPKFTMATQASSGSLTKECAGSACAKPACQGKNRWNINT